MYNKVIITRDVHFNKEKVFNSNTKIFKCDVKSISLEYLAEIIRSATRRAIIITLFTTYNNIIKDLKWFYKSEGNKEEIRFLKDLVPAWRNEYIIIVFELLFTPPNTPLNHLFITVLITIMLKDTPSKSLLSVWEYKFESV